MIVLLVLFGWLARGETVKIPHPTVKVAAIQCSSDLGEVERNLTKLLGLTEEAARHGAKIAASSWPDNCSAVISGVSGHIAGVGRSIASLARQNRGFDTVERR